jgi:Domain of unknown function (DUF4837)
MMAKIWFFFFVFLCIGCVQNHEKEILNKQYTLPDAVTVVIDKTLWQSALGDSLRKSLAIPVKGLTNEEPLFKILPIHDFKLNKKTNQCTNIIIFETDYKNSISLITNKYKKGQYIYKICAPNTQKLLAIYNQNKHTIIGQFYENNLLAVTNESFPNLKANQWIKNQFNAKVKIPKEYQMVKQSNGFCWLRKNTTNGNNNLLIYELPKEKLVNKTAFVTNVLQQRNLITSKYVLGKTTNTFMIVERAYYPSFSKTSIYNHLAYQTTGAWEFSNESITGPYINFSIKDAKRNRFLVIDGFIYNTIKNKKEFMQELEIIIRNTKIL